MGAGMMGGESASVGLERSAGGKERDEYESAEAGHGGSSGKQQKNQPARGKTDDKKLARVIRTSQPTLDEAGSDQADVVMEAARR